MNLDSRLLFFVCMVGWFSCSFVPGLSEPTPTPFNVTLVCADCAKEGIEINLWQTPERLKIVGSVPPNTPVTVLKTATYDGRLFYRVSVNDLTGWLPEDFVQK